MYNFWLFIFNYFKVRTQAYYEYLFKAYTKILGIYQQLSFVNIDNYNNNNEIYININ